jgi:hypothetical protein
MFIREGHSDSDCLDGGNSDANPSFAGQVATCFRDARSVGYEIDEAKEPEHAPNIRRLEEAYQIYDAKKTSTEEARPIHVAVNSLAGWTLDQSPACRTKYG